ncbi:MAG: YeiH family protein [Bacteroidales bacterium]
MRFPSRLPVAKVVGAAAILFVLTPLASPGLALAVGLGVALTVGNPWPAVTRRVSRPLLQASVVLLGFGTNLVVLASAARHGLLIAAATIAFTFLLGAVLRRALRLQQSTATLLSAGTAICGGSAIAAVAVATSAAEAEVSVALGTVFLLNAVALYTFPVVGHALGLSQVEFGTWAGIAIHDISSVVAAASAYGQEALQTATVVKLSRTLWIVPVALAARFFVVRQAHRQEARGGADGAHPGGRRLGVPWFIALFLTASVASTMVRPVHAVAPWLQLAARVGMTATLLLIGMNLSAGSLRKVGLRPVLHGIGLWLAISVMGLVALRLAGI